MCKTALTACVMLKQQLCAASKQKQTTEGQREHHRCYQLTSHNFLQNWTLSISKGLISKSVKCILVAEWSMLTMLLHITSTSHRYLSYALLFSDEMPLKTKKESWMRTQRWEWIREYSEKSGCFFLRDDLLSVSSTDLRVIVHQRRRLRLFAVPARNSCQFDQAHINPISAFQLWVIIWLTAVQAVKRLFLVSVQWIRTGSKHFHWHVCKWLECFPTATVFCVFVYSSQVNWK